MYRLREIERRDLPVINSWRNDRDLISHLGAPFRYIGPEVDDNWYEAYLAARTTTVRCAVVDEQDTVLGVVYLTGIDAVNRSAVLSVMVGNAENRSRGIGSFAVSEMLEHAFHNLNLNRVELSVLTENIIAIHLYEKLGFVREGVKRQARFKDGSYSDLAIYALLREDYEENVD